jgi:hypothetical protein
MKIKLNSAGLAGSVLVAFALAFALGVRAQPTATGRANDFTSVEYYEAPNQQQVKTRLAGAEGVPLAGGLLVVKQLKLEKYDVTGKLELLVEAPECVYDTVKSTASSPGKVHLQTGDGKVNVEGEGFLWRQTASLLTISNQVHSQLQPN